MNKWREKLYGYTGLFITFGIWTPMLWFISSSREHYKMETFEVFEMNWFNILLLVTLCIATLVAQFGLISIAQDLSEFEKLKRQQTAHRYGGASGA
jgi:succinate dehydrogenase hydrophobic anchor subunit